MKLRRPLIHLASIGMTAVMALASCGGDDDTSEPAASEGASSTAAGNQSATSGKPSASSSATPDPCTLVTVQDVSAALGSPIDPPELTVLPAPVGGKSCLFGNSDAPPVKTFQVNVRTNGDFAKNLRDQGQTVDKLFDDTKNLSKQSNIAIEEVSGLGDRAYKTPNAYYVIKKGVALDTNLGLNSSPSAQAQAALKTLTEKVVSRL